MSDLKVSSGVMSSQINPRPRVERNWPMLTKTLSACCTYTTSLYEYAETDGPAATLIWIFRVFSFCSSVRRDRGRRHLLAPVSRRGLVSSLTAVNVEKQTPVEYWKPLLDVWIAMPVVKSSMESSSSVSSSAGVVLVTIFVLQTGLWSWG